MERPRWPLQTEIHAQPGRMTASVIQEFIASQVLDVHFQPIFSAGTGKVFGHEALARVRPVEGKPSTYPPINIEEMFEEAKGSNLLSLLDTVCRENAFRRASEIGACTNDSFLFVNICPESLMDCAQRIDFTDRLAEKWQLPKDRIIFEITEETAVQDYDLFCRTLQFYRSQGYLIAIDDFGVGYGGLKMLAMVEPDFVKIDRHFVSHINDAIIRLNLVDSIATACHRMGIRVIAEGIENEQDLNVVQDLGIELLQGFYLGMPGPELQAANASLEPVTVKNISSVSEEASMIREIARAQSPVSSRASLPEVRAIFLTHPEIMSLPVVESERVLGMIHRKRFFEQQLQGRHGFGEALNSNKTAGQLMMESPSLVVEGTTPLEKVAQKTQVRDYHALYDDICVTSNGKYLGTVAINVLLNAITQRSLNLARSCNPLSGLPGNEIIQREIEQRISQNMHFDACYVDIDNFKPFNDHYGFERGDAVIRTLAQLIEGVLQDCGSNGFGFAGHIGGDDFLLILRPQESMAAAHSIIQRFGSRLPEFHGAGDYAGGSYRSYNRRDEPEEFSLLSLSIGIVSTEVHKFASYAELSSLASEVKHSAKLQRGDSVFRDRRLCGVN